MNKRGSAEASKPVEDCMAIASSFVVDPWSSSAMKDDTGPQEQLERSSSDFVNEESGGEERRRSSEESG